MSIKKLIELHAQIKREEGRHKKLWAPFNKEMDHVLKQIILTNKCCEQDLKASFKGKFSEREKVLFLLETCILFRTKRRIKEEVLNDFRRRKTEHQILDMVKEELMLLCVKERSSGIRVLEKLLGKVKRYGRAFVEIGSHFANLRGKFKHYWDLKRHVDSFRQAVVTRAVLVVMLLLVLTILTGFIVTKEGNGKASFVNAKGGLFTLQVSAFKTEERAILAMKHLLRWGEDPYMIKQRGRIATWHKIRIGKYYSLRDAKRHGEKLIKKKIIKEFYIARTA